jgi:hypothetical protein
MARIGEAFQIGNMVSRQAARRRGRPTAAATVVLPMPPGSASLIWIAESTGLCHEHPHQGRSQPGSRGWLEISRRRRKRAEARPFAALIAHGSFSSMPVLEVTSSAISRSRRQLAGL